MDYSSSNWKPAESECHFSWKLDEVEKDRSDRSMLEWFRGKLEWEGPIWESSMAKSTNWKRFLLQSSLAYELARTRSTGNVNEAAELLAQCLKLLECDNDYYIREYKEVLRFIALSLMEHVYVIMDEPSKAGMAQSQKKGIELNNAKSMAAILAFRAEVFGYYGSKAAFEGERIIRRALTLYREEAEWHLCLGIFLNRIRHFNRNTDNGPTDEEIDSLKLAYTKSEELLTKSAAALYLADSYLDRACWFGKCKNFYESNKWYSRQKQYLREAYALNPDGINTAAKCAKGMLKGPKKQQRREEAKEIVNKILAKHPEHIIANETASILFLSEGKFEEALKHYRTAATQGSFGSYFNYMRLMMEMKKSFCAKSFFDEMLEKFCTENYSHQIRLQAAVYYLLFEKDQVIESVRHLSYLFDCGSPLLKDKTKLCTWFSFGYELEFMKLVRNEIMLALSDIKLLNAPADRNLLEETKYKIECACPWLKGEKGERGMAENIVMRFAFPKIKDYFIYSRRVV